MISGSSNNRPTGYSWVGVPVILPSWRQLGQPLAGPQQTLTCTGVARKKAMISPSMKPPTSVSMSCLGPGMYLHAHSSKPVTPQLPTSQCPTHAGQL